ncbi:MAG: peptidase C39 [Oscillospiraceae bacterium]|nr:peptidase C39 [Oscillospiraceae bacterium]
MKVPLRYQITEYDCGPTSLLNAVSYLFDREQIPPDVPKYIMMYCLDAYNGKGEFGKNGTSRMAMMFLSNWLNQFSRAKKFPLSCDYLSGEEVGVSRHSALVGALQQGGVVVLRLWYGCQHYVLLTGACGDGVDMFDPYYRKRPFGRSGIALVPDGASCNRRVTFDVLNSEGRTPYALGQMDDREAVVLFNRETRQTAERTIEYFL